MQLFHVIVNPASKSGRGKEIWKGLEHVFEEEHTDFRVHFSESTNHIHQVMKELQKEASTEAPLYLIVFGGDGTLNQVIDSIEDFDAVKLGYIPSGSGNDFARSRNLKGTPEDMLREILKGEVHHKLDIGVLTYPSGKRHYFDVSAGIGFDAAVCAEAGESKAKVILNKLGLGKLTYVFIAFGQIISHKRPACTLVLDDEKEVKLPHFLFVAAMLHAYEGGGFKFGPEADPEDGLLDLCVAGDVNKLLFLRALPTAYEGKHYRFKGIDQYRAQKVVIKTAIPQWVHTDGETELCVERVTISCMKQRLQFLQK